MSNLEHSLDSLVAGGGGEVADDAEGGGGLESLGGDGGDLGGGERLDLRDELGGGLALAVGENLAPDVLRHHSLAQVSSALTHNTTHTKVNKATSLIVCFLHLPKTTTFTTHTEDA